METKLSTNEMIGLTKPTYKFCKWCRLEINLKNTTLSYYQKGYCGEWCWEVDNPIEIKHVCKVCGDATHVLKDRKGNSSGIYRKICDDCWVNKKYLKPKVLRVKKERSHTYKRDPIGHRCKRCDEYKLWKEFGIIKGKQTTRCKKCCNDYSKEFYKTHYARK